MDHRNIGISIRAGRTDDWDSMRRTFADAGQAAWGDILPANALADLSAPERWRPGLGTDVLVADYAGELAGFVCVRPSGDADAGPHVGEIDGFYTRPALWGQGVGCSLLSAAVARLRAAGFTEATLWTEHRNHRPLRVYRTAGWTLDGAERRRTFRGVELLELRHRMSLR
jgi:GNAT superfamily N-acetyltransferase